jgi:divalent metal cation (Fe/Co/Zn/Cd) transporter
LLEGEKNGMDVGDEAHLRVVDGQPTVTGIVILIGAIIVMPWLAREKRKLSTLTGSAAIRADAAQSGLCAYLSVIALVGLLVNGIWHFQWADPLAALIIVPLILWEARQAVRGKPCGCC